MDRRRFIHLTSATAAAGAFSSSTATGFASAISRAPGRVVPAKEDSDVRGLKLSLKAHGKLIAPTLTNTGSTAVRVKEVILFVERHSLPDQTTLYGESFQMLSQVRGTLGTPIEVGLTDNKHYRIPQPSDATTITSLVTLSPPKKDHLLLAFTSCHKFIGRFYLRSGSIEVAVDTEGLSLEPGETWKLEELIILSGPDRNLLLHQLAQQIQVNHPNPMYRVEPTGWCSYYCFGTKTTAEQVYRNLDAIAKATPELHYVQIDDGYQPAMGDWLEPGKAFGGDITGVLKQIRDRGFEPAIWVAPFIAATQSKVLAEHPDWFMQDADGKPLPSADVTFSGWGGGGWYALDGTNPDVQQHLENVFRTMRKQWGCTYFKLDANFWGAMHGGKLHDSKATRIEAYRRGMEAIRRGAGDAFILGCNQPIWPSLGLVHGSRSSGDIKRSWPTFRSCAQQTLGRNWQNGTLWWNDPDAVLLTGTLSSNEYQFHATAAFASGGMMLSGDDLTSIPPDRLAMLHKLLPPTRTAAVFDDAATQEVGRTQLADGLFLSVFNPSDAQKSIEVRLRDRARLIDFWTGDDLGEHAGAYTVESVPPHSARLLQAIPVKT